MAPFLYEKIPLTDYHFGNPSTGFSVEPGFILAVFLLANDLLDR